MPQTRGRIATRSGPTARRRHVRLALVLAALATSPGLPPAPRATAQAPRAPARAGIPTRLSDAAFWRLVTDLSEEGGFFRSDNLVSNEVTYQHVIPELTRRAAAGGVYLGVGPDQNFSYIAALRPRIAFVIDIRRQNMLQHLMYKALIEMSPDRAEFLSRLFSRRRPPGLGAGTPAAGMLEAYGGAAPDSALFRRNLAAVRRQLVRHHRFALSADDLRAIEYVYGAFFSAGPDLTYTFGSARGGPYRVRWMPTYAELMAQTDAEGEPRSYLATEANYRVLRDLERNNLLVPLVGDFAGDKALRAVGRYVKEHGATVSAFYTSNVEQYLFRQGDDWRRFFENVATLPVDSSSTFVRAVFNFAYSGFGMVAPPGGPAGPRSVTLLCPIADVVTAFSDGRIQTYFDVVQMSQSATPTVSPQ